MTRATFYLQPEVIDEINAADAKPTGQFGSMHFRMRGENIRKVTYRLGREMGFDPATLELVDGAPFFTAEPLPRDGEAIDPAGER